MKQSIFILFTLFIISSCGLKKPLYLPKGDSYNANLDNNK